MAAVVDHSPQPHSPPGPDAQRPKGILKNSSQKSPPLSPTEKELTDKEITILNTQSNAGRRRSSSAVRPNPGSRRGSSRTPSISGEPSQDSQRLKWDEANLYLAEQERTATMKITEPKTPYAKQYDPAEHPSDDEDEDMEGSGLASNGARRNHNGEDDIPVMSLGEPEEAVPESESGKEKQLKVHVDDSGAAADGGHHGEDEEMVGLSPEEREKHRRFEQMRKKHYEMKNVAHLLGHPEDLPEDEEDEDAKGPPPPMPQVPDQYTKKNGTQ